MVVFPAFWTHYTESSADEDKLCTAHTIQWSGKLGGQIGTVLAYDQRSIFYGGCSINFKAARQQQAMKLK